MLIPPSPRAQFRRSPALDRVSLLSRSLSLTVMAEPNVQDLFGSDSEDDGPPRAADTPPQPPNGEQDAAAGLFGSESDEEEAPRHRVTQVLGEDDDEAPPRCCKQAASAASAATTAVAAAALAHCCRPDCSHYTLGSSTMGGFSGLRTVHAAPQSPPPCRSRSPSPQAPRGPPLRIAAEPFDVLPQDNLRLVKLPYILGVEQRPFEPETFDAGELSSHQPACRVGPRRALKHSTRCHDAGVWPRTHQLTATPARRLTAQCAHPPLCAGKGVEIDARGMKRVRLADYNCIR